MIALSFTVGMWIGVGVTFGIVYLLSSERKR